MSPILSFVLVVVGAALVLVTTVDAIGGFFRIGANAGLLTRPFENGVSRAVLSLVRISGHRGSLNLVGPLCVVARTIVSVATLWLGWSLIYVAFDEALLAAQSGAEAGILERFYFAGYVVSTLGLGDFQPGNDTWRLVTTFASLSGFMFLTFLVSFMVTISSQISERRALAMMITAAGAGPYAILRRYRNGDTVDLSPLLSMIALPVIKTAEASTNLPLLHRFHSADVHGSYAVAIARLDETLTMLEYGCDGGRHPEIALVRHGVDMIIAALPSEWLGTADAPSPSVARLREAGIDCVGDQQLAEGMSEASIRDRRRKLKSMVEALGFSWQQHVYGENPDRGAGA